MEKRYLIKDISHIIEFHDSEEGLDFSLLTEEDNVIDGGFIENFEGTEKEALQEIEKFLDHIQPRVNLSEENIIDISSIDKELTNEEMEYIISLNNLFENVFEYDYYDIYSPNDPESSTQAINDIYAEFINNPHNISRILKQQIENADSEYPYLKELNLRYKEIEIYAIEKDIREYKRENDIDFDYLSSSLQEYTVGDMAISTLYVNVLKMQDIEFNNLHFTTKETSFPGDYEIFISSDTGATLELSVDLTEGIESMASDIFEIKQFGEIQTLIEKELSSDKEKPLSEDEKKYMLIDFNRYISNMDIKSFPENTTELTMNYITKVKTNAEINRLQIQPNINGIRKTLIDSIGENVHINSIEDLNRIQENIIPIEECAKEQELVNDEEEVE